METRKNVYIIGITGKIGTLLTKKLLKMGIKVKGLVRSVEQKTLLENNGVQVTLGNLENMEIKELTKEFCDSDIVIFAAGSNGGSKEVTKNIDGDGVKKTISAIGTASNKRFILVSVLPESWRERNLEEEVEYYFSVKKQADIMVSRSDLSWVIIRPSLLTDNFETGKISMGAAEFHGQISRGDVAELIVEIIYEPEISRQILEVNEGVTPIKIAVKKNIR